MDIDKRKEVELIDLNHRIVARLKFLQQIRAHASMLESSIGERVSFQPDGRGLPHGIVAKYNRKSVAIIAEDRPQWNVAPGLLRKIAPVPASSSSGGKVATCGRNIKGRLELRHLGTHNAF